MDDEPSKRTLALTSSDNRKNSDGKSKLTTAEIVQNNDGFTRNESVLSISSVKCSYFGIFSVVNGPYFVAHTILYNAFKFSTVPRVT